MRFGTLGVLKFGVHVDGFVDKNVMEKKQPVAGLEK